MKTITICISCNTLNRINLEKAESQTPKCGHCQQGISLHGAVLDATPAALNHLIAKAKNPIIVDFWAPWCGPCLAFAPTFEAASKEFAEQFTFIKLNTEQFNEGSQQYNIRGIPTLIVFKNGNEMKRQSGAMPLPMLRSFLQQL